MGAWDLTETSKENTTSFFGHEWFFAGRTSIVSFNEFSIRFDNALNICKPYGLGVFIVLPSRLFDNCIHRHKMDVLLEEKQSIFDDFFRFIKDAGIIDDYGWDDYIFFMCKYRGSFQKIPKKIYM